ncbi:MAG: universal stress protein [Armatimonadota bacterium]
MYRCILVGFDGSDGARKALDAGIALARVLNAELHVIMVEEDLPKYAATIGEYEEVKHQRDAYFAQLKQEAHQMAQQAGVLAQTHIVAGHEVWAIVEFIQHHGVDLLVIGHQGHSTLHERVFGSTASALVNHAPCHVLVVK